MPITIYTTPTCTYCSQVKKFLKDANTPYVEVDITKNKEAKEELLKRGYRGVPVTHDGKEWVLGYQEEALAKMTKK